MTRKYQGLDFKVHDQVHLLVCYTQISFRIANLVTYIYESAGSLCTVHSVYSQQQSSHSPDGFPACSLNLTSNMPFHSYSLGLHKEPPASLKNAKCACHSSLCWNARLLCCEENKPQHIQHLKSHLTEPGGWTVRINHCSQGLHYLVSNLWSVFYFKLLILLTGHTLIKHKTQIGKTFQAIEHAG